MPDYLDYRDGPLGRKGSATYSLSQISGNLPFKISMQKISLHNITYFCFDNI